VTLSSLAQKFRDRIDRDGVRAAIGLALTHLRHRPWLAPVQRRLGAVRDARLGRTAKPPQVHHAIERFSVFQGALRIAGWAYVDDGRIETLILRLPDGAAYRLRSFGRRSADLAQRHGPAAARARFDELLRLPQGPDKIAGATLEIRFAAHPSVILSGLGLAVNDPTHDLVPRFAHLMALAPPGRLLEVGSRARSGVVRRGMAPAGWTYEGLDVMAGPNVDTVGDAHRLSSLYPPHHFDAVMSYSVLEHLMMPWKFVIELNRVLKPGAIGLFTTHQCWPLHDEPWDFWRFSDTAWLGLLNAATGFEIIEARMGEPAFVVAAKVQPGTAFPETPAGALASFVLFRKIGETTLDWPVELEGLTQTLYPANVTGP
jgi:SAM-dependent methyltransferase